MATTPALLIAAAQPNEHSHTHALAHAGRQQLP
jgi:hypothetical protein